VRRATKAQFAFVVLALGGSVAAVPANGASFSEARGEGAVQYADALVQFPKHDGKGWLSLTLTITHGVVGDDYPDQFEVLAETCTADGCTAAGVTRAALSADEFTYSADLTRATLELPG
jgi:hypothetical protein